MSFDVFEDERNIRYLLQNAKLLEKFDLSVFGARSLVGILSLSPRTLKVLHTGQTCQWVVCVKAGFLSCHNRTIGEQRKVVRDATISSR